MTKQQSTNTAPGLWAFDRSSEWVSRYGKCSNKATRTAPLNIDTSDVAPCNALCQLAMKYEPTTCSISMVNNIPTVTFNPNCIIKFKNDFFYLRKMTIHYTSMHTMNDSYYDLEVLLYHNRNPINDSDGGVIISILMKKGVDYGQANEFMNEFINQMPANDMPIEQDITVSDNWNPEQLFPESKSFFYYDGALPYPPCNTNWTFIIFEEAVPISQNIIDTVHIYILGNNLNIRPIQHKPSNINIFYNANSKLDTNQDLSDANNLDVQPTLPVKANLSSTSWLKQNIYYIKGIVITLVLIMMIYVAIKFASVIVKNDMLNNFIIRQLKKKETREIATAQDQQAKQQSAEGAPPVQTANLPNNNNNNNNNNN
jgi:carbonic anhydrase